MRTHLDIACGTGLAVDHFARRGWSSFGLDASLSMLQVAAPRAPRRICADFRRIPLRGRVHWVTCLYDSLNHLLEADDLRRCFRAVAEVMSEQSLFLFDMNHPAIYEEVWGMKEPFVATGGEFRLEIATTFRRREGIGRARVSGWATLPGGGRARILERHQQRSYSEQQIRSSLREAGLEPLEVLGFDPYDEKERLDVEGVKLFFVCRRR